MSKGKSYEQFPLWIPLTAIILSFSTYIIGAAILIEFSIIIALLYLLYCIGIELLVVIRSCKHCYYYNKLCGLGKGKYASFLVKKGDPKKFIEREVTVSDLLPDFLVALFPIAGGIILSIIDFSFIRIGLLILLILLSTSGTAFLRGSFACKYCKQRQIGCPADQFFNKNKKTDKTRI
jgi:hypothetical protein